MRTGILAVTAILGGFILAARITAHHGAAEFDTRVKVTLSGNVTEFAFSNPHVQVYFEVRNAKGEMEKWLGDLPAPNSLIRMGWNKRTLKPGDSVTFSGYPAHGGVHALWISKLIGPDGTSLPLFEG